MNNDLRSTIHVLLPFLVFGVLWITFIDQIVLKYWSDGIDVMSQAQLFKGLLFVALNGILVFFLVRRYMRIIRSTDTKQTKVLQHTADIVYLFDPDFMEVRYVNNRITEVLGYLPEEVINHKSVFFKTLNKSEESLQHDLTQIREGDSLDREITVFHKDGSTRILQSRITAFEDPDLKKTMLLGVVSDLTQVIHDKEYLSRLNDRLVELINSISDGFMAIRDDWTVSYANHIMAGITGVPVEEAMDKPIWELIDFGPDSLTRKKLLEAHGTREKATFDTLGTQKEMASNKYSPRRKHDVTLGSRYHQAENPKTRARTKSPKPRLSDG